MDNRDTFRFEFYGKGGEAITLEFDSNSRIDILQNIQRFLTACGYTFFGTLTDYVEPKNHTPITGTQFEVNSDGYRLGRAPLHEPKWDFSNIPNNNWPFGKLKSEPLPALTTVDLTPLTVTDLTTMTTHSYSDWTNINKYPTMAPLTTEQVASWKMEAPGTLGGAKVTFDKDAY